LRAGLRRRFGKGVPPVSIRTVTALPRNVGGKIDRRALAGSGVTPARTAGSRIEQEVADIWRELLGADVAGPDDTFFAAGGHSMLATRLLDRVRKRLGVEVSLWQFLSNPTPAGLAGLVEARVLLRDAEERQAVPTQAATQRMAG
ncbi:phosphopantetheine-binding protein, partial [Nonomuraea sp. NPDC004297]